MEKFCPDCKENKDTSLFHKNKNTKDGLYAYCKTCNSKRVKDYIDKNKEKLSRKRKERYAKNRKKERAQQKIYADTHKEQIAIQGKKNREANPGVNAQKCKKYQKENVDKINKKRRVRVREKEKSDPVYKLTRRLRTRLYKFVKGENKKGSAVKDLGCSPEELKIHLESLFYPHPFSGVLMTWENYGKGLNKWQIDHIEALCLFDLTVESDLLRACHFSNLQPLWHEDHTIKTESDILKKEAA